MCKLKTSIPKTRIFDLFGRENGPRNGRDHQMCLRTSRKGTENGLCIKIIGSELGEIRDAARFLIVCIDCLEDEFHAPGRSRACKYAVLFRCTLLPSWAFKLIEYRLPILRHLRSTPYADVVDGSDKLHVWENMIGYSVQVRNSECRYGIGNGAVIRNLPSLEQQAC